MSKSVETRTARFDHQCAKCYKVIPKGSEYYVNEDHKIVSSNIIVTDKIVG